MVKLENRLLTLSSSQKPFRGRPKLLDMQLFARYQLDQTSPWVSATDGKSNESIDVIKANESKISRCSFEYDFTNCEFGY